VTLLGDAAHPVLPFMAQGAALAIEDAATVAHMLARMPDDPAEAFARFQQSRLPRATRVQETARKNGSIYHLPFPLSLARDLVIRQKNSNLLADYDWLYGWTLPD
jgi:salicylate hydroxylase